MKIKKADIYFIFFCIITAGIFAAYRYFVGDFVAYNGDFQNYNVFRRLLDKQIPYKDFTNYLGNGMILVNFPLLWIFRSFGAAVFVTNFTSSILYSLIICVSFYTITHQRKSAYIITSLFAIIAFLVLHAGFNGKFYYDYIYDIVFFEELGHSMRTTRAFLPFMLVGFFYILKNLLKKANPLQDILSSNRWVGLIFMILGMMITWSNDYGYACVACLFIIIILVNLFSGKAKFFRRLLLYSIAIVSAVTGAVLSITGITHGNLMDYINASKGVAEYQFWYYGAVYGKFMTVADLFADEGFAALTVIFLLYAVHFLACLIRGKINDDSICKLFLYSTCYSASLIYAVGSGSHNYAPVKIMTYILMTEWIGKGLYRAVFFYKKRFSGKLSQKINAVKKYFHILYANKMTIYFCGMLFLYCMAVNILRKDITYQDKEEVQGLHVNSVIGAGLDKYASEFSEGSLFSTYAGALETVNNIFQPTGTDYIIHVLGDEQRLKYLAQFRQGGYQYATTLKNEYTSWEYWVSRANWFFYRELYMWYEPVNETTYSVIWEKQQNKNVVETEVRLSQEYINASTYKIEVELPNLEDGAYVDLLLKYDVSWTQERLKKGGIRKVLCVQDGGERYNSYNRNACYYLDEQSDGCYIPVHVQNGKGYAYISAYPLSCTKLENVAVSVQNVIREPEYELHVTNYTDLYRYVSADSVSQGGKLLKFDNTEFIYGALDNVEQIRSGKETGIVDSVWKDGDYIYVTLQNAIDSRKYVYPNALEVVKKDKIYMTENYTNDEWIGGISRKDGKILLNREIEIEGLYAVKTCDVTKKIKKIEVTEKGYCLSLEDNTGIQIFAYPQEFQLIYR